MLEAETHSARGSTAALRQVHAQIAALKGDLDKEVEARQVKANWLAPCLTCRPLPGSVVCCLILQSHTFVSL